MLTWRPGERYVLITTSVPVVVSFAIGDARYDVGPIALQGSFAPFLVSDEAYLPLRDVLHALDLDLRRDGNATILQPVLASLDVRDEGARVTLFAHAGAVLHPRVVADTPSSITYAFDGVGTTLSGNHSVGVGGVRGYEISSSGSARAPITLVKVDFDAGTFAEAPQNTDGRDVLLAFDGATAQAPPNAPPNLQTPPPEVAPPPEVTPAPENQPAAAIVTGVTVQPSNDGVVVNVAVSGNAQYEWHRLRDPDNRFWVDIRNAQLQGAPIEQAEPNPLISMRVRQDDPTTVRIALSLSGPTALGVTPSADGLQIAVGTEAVADAPRAGSGTLGTVASFVTPAPLDDTAWKFAPKSNYVPTNPRLIVIDPGHGGSDRGSIHGGIAEADVNLDMAKRLRAILEERGWQVRMTHDTDVDVYEPNDSAHDELQARVDVANRAGARLFISVHANAFINPGPYGTTTYVSKPEDVALGRIVAAHLESDGTKDDGVIKAHYYVTFHTRMPAVLIETAFLTNPHDYALLSSSAWRQKVAEEIADGIAQYVQEHPLAGDAAQ